MFRRVQSAVRETISEHQREDEMLIVAHGASGHAIICGLLGYPIESRTTLPVLDNGSLTIVEQRSNRWHLASHSLAQNQPMTVTTGLYTGPL
jgi:broad specificity phosphatase PhoE